LAILLEEMGEAQQAIGRFSGMATTALIQISHPYRITATISQGTGDVQYAINILMATATLTVFSSQAHE